MPNKNGSVFGLYIAPAAGAPMQPMQEVKAITGSGLSGDRYCEGAGSWNKGNQGKRQVTLINSIFFSPTQFGYADARRNIVTHGVELMWLIGREFQVGEAILRGVKYCDPCERPSVICGKEGFRTAFFDRGGLIAEVVLGGVIEMRSSIIPPPKGY